MRPGAIPLRTLAALAGIAALLGTGFAAPAQGQAADEKLREALAGALRGGGPGASAYVIDADDGRVLFSSAGSTRRILASNAKLFTTAAAFDRFGADGAFKTEVLASGRVEDSVLDGDLYLKGGGDPTFGSSGFAGRSYGGGGSVEELARQLELAGIERVSGRVLGDESRFDSRRGVPGSGYAVSIYIGPLSALAFDRGLTSSRGSAFARSPAGFAAGRLDAALEREGVSVRGAPGTGVAPANAESLASVASPPVSRLARITNKPSDNFFAEMLVKDLGAADGLTGTTARGTRKATSFARSLGSAPKLVDGSGLSRGNSASPKSVVALLRGMRSHATFASFYASLPIAGRDGTLGGRMRSGPAAGNCRAKTGTLTNVSALSGYCRSRSGRTLAFSFLMNRVSPASARGVQDRMAQALAGYGN